MALPWAASRGYALPEGIDPSELRVLSAKEAAIFLAVARRVLRGAPFDAAEEAAFVPWVDAYLGRQAAPLRQEVRGLLWAFEHAPPFLGFGVSRFSQRSGPEQDAILQSWATSRFGLCRQGYCMGRPWPPGRGKQHRSSCTGSAQVPVESRAETP